MKRSLCGALSLVLAGLAPASAAVAVEPVAPATLSAPAPAAAFAVSPSLGAPALSAAGPSVLSAADIGPEIGFAGSLAAPAPAASAPAAVAAPPDAPRPAAANRSPETDGPRSAALFDGASGPATIALVELARDAAAARIFLASHRDARGLSADRFQETLRRIYMTSPRGRGAGGTMSLAALNDRARRSPRDKSTQALARVMNDVSRLAAEGMIRARVSVPTPEQLDAREAGWERDDAGRPIADVAVIGAGPAGLSTGLHAADAGLKTVVFEAGYVAQSFADAAMKAVYRMRTPTTRNSLAQAPFSSPELVADAGMTGRLAQYRAAGQAADSALYALTRAPPLLGARTGLDAPDPTIASARGELLQHFADTADAIARRDGIVAERSRVESARKDADGLWTLTVNGRVQRARKLVLAQGQVGVEVEHAQFPPDLLRAARQSGLSALLLKDYRDVNKRNGALDSMTRALSAGKIPSFRLMINDALLGSARVERAFRLLAPRTRVMIVGSGESAVKAAVAVLRLNPRISVDLYVKDRLQPAQLQIPAAHAAPDAIARALADPAAAERSLREWEAIGTPVTPATLADLEALRRAGRLNIIPLGKKCIAAAVDDPDPAHTIEIARSFRDGRERLKVFAVDPDVIRHLQAEGIGRVDKASGRWLVSEIDGPIVAAVGYSRASLRTDPITRSLTEQGRLVPTHGDTKATANEFAMSRTSPLRSAGDADLYLVGAQNVAMSADSAIPGAVARAASIVAEIRADLSAAAPRAPPAAARTSAARDPRRRLLAAVRGWTRRR